MSGNQPNISAANVARRIADEVARLPNDLVSSLFLTGDTFEDFAQEATETLDENHLAVIEQRMSTTPLPLILALLTECTIERFFSHPSSKALPSTIARVQKLVNIIHRLGEYDASVVLVRSIASRAAQSEDLTAMHAGRHLQKALTMPAILELLVNRLEDPQHFSSRPSILSYLQAISEIGLDALLAALNTVKEKETRSLLINIISKNQIPDPERLLQVMRNAKPIVMLDYFDLAPYVSTEVLASLILVALEQEHPALIMRVLRLLPKFPPGAADKLLAKHLAHKLMEVRIVAYQVAAIRRSQACRASLRLQILSDEIWQLEPKEVRALTCAFAAISGTDSISALSKLLKPKMFQKKNVDVQLSAAFALSQLKDPRARAHIEKAAKSMNAKVREGCKRALAPGAGEANLAATLGSDFVERGFVKFEPNEKDWLQRIIDRQRKEKNLLVENAQGVYDEDPRDTRTEDELFANVLRPHNQPDELPTNLVSAPEEKVSVGSSPSSQAPVSDRETVPEMPAVSFGEHGMLSQMNPEPLSMPQESFSEGISGPSAKNTSEALSSELEEDTVQWSVGNVERTASSIDNAVPGVATEQDIPVFLKPDSPSTTGVPSNEFDERIPTQPRRTASHHSVPPPPGGPLPGARSINAVGADGHPQPSQGRHRSQFHSQNEVSNNAMRRPNPASGVVEHYPPNPHFGRPATSIPPPPGQQPRNTDPQNARTYPEMPQWQAPPPGWSAPSNEPPYPRPFSDPGSQPNRQPVRHPQIQQQRERHSTGGFRPNFPPAQAPQAPGPHSYDIPAGREPTRRKLSDDFKKPKVGERPPTRDEQRPFTSKNDSRFKK
ncbi:MAG: hypothetical protein VYC39_15465 [Myxococcota bacterium]|nr:hypothetical protein [Myxococcota bacterium]